MKTKKMNPITRALWDRDLTVKKWAAINNFNGQYVQAVILGNRGERRSGTAKKIMRALIDQGFVPETPASGMTK